MDDGITRSNLTEMGEDQWTVVELPAPTAWPIVLALGMSLMLAGMVTHWGISLLGLLLSLAGVAGWFAQVMPHEHHEPVAVVTKTLDISSTRTASRPGPVGENHRKIIPIETFSLISGIRGGIAGGLAMTIPATIFSLVRYDSIWYAINLLAAGGFVSWAGKSDAFLAQFHLEGLLAASAIHGVTSLLVGLLYGAMLPMFSRKPILTAGFVAPFLWSGLLYTVLGIVSPILDQRIDWLWFVVSQIVFGLVAGYVVNLHVKVRTPQFRALPFAVRAGLELPGEHVPEKPEKDSR